MTNKSKFTKLLSSLVCLVLITAVALTFTGCDTNKPSTDTVSSVTEEPVSSEQSELKFTFIVVDAEGNSQTFDISTTEKTVGAALLKEGLIEGEEGQYGLYVKKVNGITADYNTDGTYWAFYIGDSYASTGVDSTDIVEGETYTFKVEK